MRFLDLAESEIAVGTANGDANLKLFHLAASAGMRVNKFRRDDERGFGFKRTHTHTAHFPKMISV